MVLGCRENKAHLSQGGEAQSKALGGSANAALPTIGGDAIAWMRGLYLKKRFIGPISKSLLRNCKNAGILFVSSAKSEWISCPNGDSAVTLLCFRGAHSRPRR